MSALRPVAALALLLAPAITGASLLSVDEAQLKERPVSKVISILKDMLKTMEKEQEEDEEIYDKLACWCATNDREKTKAIEEAEARIASLEASIEEDTAASAQLNTEIKNTEQEVAKNQKALDEATAIREKELAEFNEEGYAPQSGEIFGILQQMKETFEKDLGETQKSEAANQKAYEEVKAAKLEQIAAGQAMVDKKTQELADTDERLAHSRQDIEDTKNSLSADERFLMDLKERCKMTDSEWETRQKTRALEMEAVSKALAILSSDEVHNLFTRTFNPSLAQLKSGAHSGRREQASLLLSRAASKLHSPRLSNLALRVKLDAFTRVKKAIDDMVAALLEEKAAEIKHKDFCVKELDENQMETEKKEREKQELEALIDTLESTIKDLTDALDTLKAEIADLTKQIKMAGEDREKENMEFQKVLADQRETQKVLAAAQAALAAFYGEAKLLQQGPAPPAGFDEYKKSASSAGVMDLIKNIIADAKAMEDETTRDEEDAQKAYEDFVLASNDSIEAKKREITAKSAEKAKAEGELVEAKTNKGKVMTELEQLSNMNAQLHSSCDFILKNFELRQTARDEEVQALRQAKDILSGSHFGEFLQAA